MIVHLSDEELKEAITSHLSGQENIDLDPELYDVDIQLTAGRGEKGHYADITRTKRGGAALDDNPFSLQSTADEISNKDKADPKPDEPGIDFG